MSTTFGHINLVPMDAGAEILEAKSMAIKLETPAFLKDAKTNKVDYY